MTGSSDRAARILALLDDAASGAALLELTSALAGATRRELSVVYVESAASLRAAALPFAQVLAHAASAWQPLQASDIEQGFRAHAARLRRLAADAARQHGVGWSLRVVRGRLCDAPALLADESNLVFVAAAAQPRHTIAPPRRRPHRVVVALGTAVAAADLRAEQVAGQLAQALSGSLELRCLDPGAEPLGWLGTLAGSAWPDALVLARTDIDAATSARLRCPVLLVG